MSLISQSIGKRLNIPIHLHSTAQHAHLSEQNHCLSTCKDGKEVRRRQSQVGSVSWLRWRYFLTRQPPSLTWCNVTSIKHLHSNNVIGFIGFHTCDFFVVVSIVRYCIWFFVQLLFPLTAEERRNKVEMIGRFYSASERSTVDWATVTYLLIQYSVITSWMRWQNRSVLISACL